MQYRILDGSSPRELNDRVNDHLADGWELYGTPIITYCELCMVICQAVIKQTIEVKI